MPKTYKIPSISALSAFESAARHLNFSIAAEELNTSQSAISRHIQSIERRFKTSLFDRHNRRHNRLSLTYAGEQYYREVQKSLGKLNQATREISNRENVQQLTIACSHEVSHLILMPQFERLQNCLGEETQLRVITSEYDALLESQDPRVDIRLFYQPQVKSADGSVVVCIDAARPVCSPAFYAKHSQILKKPTDAWQELPFLKLTKPNFGWASWDDWFKRSGNASISPTYLPYDNYVYLLEAAATGKGIALGWHTFDQRHISEGMLVPLFENYVERESALHGVFTAKGSSNPQAEICLQILCQNNSIKQQQLKIK